MRVPNTPMQLDFSDSRSPQPSPRKERGEGEETERLLLHATTGFGTREIANAISAATTHSAPAMKNAGKYVASAVRERPAPKAALAAPS